MRPYDLIAIALLMGAPAMADTGADTPRVIYLPCTSALTPTADELERGIWGTRQAPASYNAAAEPGREIITLALDPVIWPIGGGSGARPEEPVTPDLPAVPLSGAAWFMGSILVALIGASLVFRRAQ